MESAEIRFRSAINLLQKKYPHKDIAKILDIGASIDTTRLLWETFHCEIATNYIPQGTQDSSRPDILRKVSKSIKFELGESTSVLSKIEPNSYDLLYCGEIIEHIYNIRDFFKNCLSVLKQGGILLGTTPNLVAWQSRFLCLLGLTPSTYHPFPIRKRPLFSPIDKADFPLYEYHIRVTNPSLLMQYLHYMNFENPDYCSTNEYGTERSLHRLRYVLNFILPRNWKEDIIFIANKCYDYEDSLP